MNKYTIWVGGTEVNDYYVDKKTADRIAEEYKLSGYDDVKIKKID